MATTREQQREELFAREYVIDGNGTRSAIAAGYASSGADVQAVRLLARARVKRRIAELQAKRFSKLDIKAERILEELAKVAFSDPRQFFYDTCNCAERAETALGGEELRRDAKGHFEDCRIGELKPISELDADTAACLAGFDIEELFQHFGKGQATEIGQVKKYKMADRLRALELLGKTMAMFTDKVKHEGLDGLAESIAKGRKRLATGS